MLPTNNIAHDVIAREKQPTMNQPQQRSASLPIQMGEFHLPLSLPGTGSLF
jgi:hypothetical protein